MPEMTFRVEAQYVEAGYKWLKEHPCKHRNLKYKGAIGGGVTWKFTDTTIGQLQVIKCSCGDSKLVNGDDL